MHRLMICLVALLALAACGGAEPKWASDAAVAQARYVHSTPRTLTLYTVLNKRSGAGAQHRRITTHHFGLLAYPQFLDILGDQRLPDTSVFNKNRLCRTARHRL